LHHNTKAAPLQGAACTNKNVFFVQRGEA